MSEWAGWFWSMGLLVGVLACDHPPSREASEPTAASDAEPKGSEEVEQAPLPTASRQPANQNAEEPAKLRVDGEQTDRGQQSIESPPRGKSPPRAKSTGRAGDKQALANSPEAIKEKFDSRCQKDRECGELAGIDCMSALDGPYYYVKSKTLEVVARCGGACMSRDCPDCPPSEWTCPVSRY